MLNARWCRYLVDGHEPSYLAASARVVLASSPRSSTYKARFLSIILVGVLGIVVQCAACFALLHTVCYAWLAVRLSSRAADSLKSAQSLPCLCKLSGRP